MNRKSYQSYQSDLEIGNGPGRAEVFSAGGPNGPKMAEKFFNY